MSADLSLARRATACRAWRWTPGMRVLDGVGGAARIIVERDDGSGALGIEEHVGGPVPLDAAKGRALPDLDDPATLGCLLALVREAWCHERLWVEWVDDIDDGGWSIGWLGRLPIRACPPTAPCSTESEALVAALEAAPEFR